MKYHFERKEDGRRKEEISRIGHRKSLQRLDCDSYGTRERQSQQRGPIRIQQGGKDSLFYNRKAGGRMIIVFDTETTGLLNPESAPLESQPRIIEFAAIKLDNDLKELERLEFICNPQCKLSDKITEITGLRDSDVEDKPLFSAFYEQLCNFFLGCDTGIAHNYTFDLGMLRYEMTRMGKQFMFPWPFKTVCTVEKTMHIRGHRLNLTKLHHHCTGEDHINGAHRAMADVEALLRCVKKLREQDVL